MQRSEIDLAAASPVNDLWSALVATLGLERGARAARQALDLQAMHGTPSTLPLLLVETCGIALVQRQQLRAATGLPVADDPGVLLLFSCRQAALQLLHWQG